MTKTTTTGMRPHAAAWHWYEQGSVACVYSRTALTLHQVLVGAGLQRPGRHLLLGCDSTSLGGGLGCQRALRAPVTESSGAMSLCSAWYKRRAHAAAVLIQTRVAVLFAELCGTAPATGQRPVTCKAQLRLAGFWPAWGSAASLPTCFAWLAMGWSQGVVRYLMANTLQ